MSNKLKIAQIVCTFPPYKGGVGNVAYQFSKGSAELGHEVTVFTPKYNQTNQDENRGFKIVRIPSLFKFGNAAMLRQINKYLKKGNFDIIHLHYPFFPTSYFVYKFKKKFPQKKLVITYHMDAIGWGLKGLLFILYSKILMPRILNSADIITTASLDYIENSQAGKVFKNNITKFTELPYGVDWNQFKPQEKDKNLMNKLSVQPDDKIILFVGGLDKAHYFKGLKYLIQAAKLINDDIKNLKILIIGEGELKEYYINLAKKLRLENKIKFVGVGEYGDLPKYYNLCDLFILPSINSAEAFGLVLTEAMACGKTVLASNLPGVRTVPVSGELLFEPANPKEIADKIKWLFGDDNSMKKFGEEGRRKVEEKYDWNKTIAKLEKIYRNI
ncbi:MAG: glycosyltransferase family 4 protein [bacterium]